MFNTFEFIGTSFLRPDIIWFLAGLIMLLIEFIAPGIFFLFFANGAWVVVILTLVFDMPLSMQLLSFLVFSIASLVVLRKRFKKIFTGNQSHNVTIDDEFIGARARTVSKISSSQPGKVKFRGTTWSAESQEDIPENTFVTIVKRNSLVLTVKKSN